ncbi:MAG: heparinase II/III family protein [Acidobacteria bacterium]|nr:heparinase II/III family protein [Acidobacteriota bacterium]
MMATQTDLAAAVARAEAEPWARAVMDQTVNAAKAWPQSHLTKYGLKELALPPEPGQWTLWDVCPVHGVSLRYTPPDVKTCPIDNKRWSGWPYDQVTYDRRLDDLAGAARDLGLAFRFTGERVFAEQSAWILKEFAAKYLSYPLHDKDNRNTRSGARVHAQTLDEAIWLINVAWAYDLLAGSDVLTDADRADIEKNLLRAAVETIQRYDAGISNWQSWHNAAIGAVGFALGDQGLISAAIDGKSGFRFQMLNSVTPDGYWYEGAWGYHFYAFDAHLKLATMASRNGIDLFGELPLRRMFDAPLQLVLPSGNLPAFNDSKEVNLYGYDRLYEYAWAMYGDPSYAAVLGRRSRSLDALLWGNPEIPKVELTSMASAVFPESGYAVLRAPEGDHTIAIKFGPHGGGHGHYDKLNFISYALGATMGLDPGTQSYAAPTHNTWDKVTVAHNTVAVDETTQGESAGALVWAELEHPVYRAVRASAGTGAYWQALLARTMVLTGEYALDVFDVESRDGAEHQMDWIYHNDGVLTDFQAGAAATAYPAFPKTNGYQHLTEAKAASTEEAWQVVIDAGTAAPFNGSAYASNSNVSGTIAPSAEQAVSAPNSVKLTYAFNGAGYVLLTASRLAPLPEAVPARVKLWVYGDNSGHKLAFRLYDSTDERFVTPQVVVNWTGWKEFEFDAPEGWSHYLGNNDGVLDLPVKQISFEITNAGGETPRSGVLYADDVRFLYDAWPETTAAAFDPPLRKIRVWMLGAPGTTVVTGRGLGPVLPNTAPFVMARRKAAGTQFVTLLEPFERQPAVTAFERDAEGRFVVETAAFRDTFRVTAEGVREFERTRKE